MQIRIAKVSDAVGIAAVYAESNRTNPHSFMLRLGQPFLTAYYRIVLSCPGCVALCAVDADQKILGFASGTIDAAEQLKALNRHKVTLLFAALPSLLRKPSLISQMRSRSKVEGNEFIVADGARWEYWAWSPSHKGSSGAMQLHRAWRSVLRSIGVKSVRLEINTEDQKLAFLHGSQGAKLVRSYATPSGLERQLLEYTLG